MGPRAWGFEMDRQDYDSLYTPIPDPRWLNRCNITYQGAACCNVWVKRVVSHTRHEALTEIHHRRGTIKNLDKIHDLFEPSWNCETRERLPLKPGEGAKYVCGLSALRNRSLIYSFGSAGDVLFEVAMKKRLPAGEIFTFDPFLKLDARQKMQRLEQEGLLTFIPRALGVGPASLGSLARSLRHSQRKIDVLKVDIEGSEYSAFNDTSLFGNCLKTGKLGTRMELLLVEIHTGMAVTNLPKMGEYMALLAFFRQARACGLALFSKDGAAGMEYGFISSQLAFREHVLTHPCCIISTG